MWAACFNSYLPTAGRAWSLIENSSVKIGSVFCVVTVFAVLYAFVGIHGWMGYELTSGLTTLE